MFSLTKGDRVQGLPFYELQEVLDHVPTRMKSNLFMYLSATYPPRIPLNPAFGAGHHERMHPLRALMHVCDISKHDQRVSVQTAAL